MNEISNTNFTLAPTLKSGTISLALAAEKIGVSFDKLVALINRGEGPPFIQLGRDKVFREGTIDV